MMTARRLYQQARLAGDASLSPLLEVLYRDNFSYYILMFFTRIANIYIVSHGTNIISFMCFDNVDLVGGPYFNLDINFLWAFVATLTIQLFLTLRNVATSQDWQEQTGMMTTIAQSSIGDGNIWFARPPRASAASRSESGPTETGYNGTIEEIEI